MHNVKEDIRVRKELREFRMMRTIAVATASSKEQIAYSQADMKGIADPLMDDILGIAQDKGGKKHISEWEQKDLAAKKAFLESSTTSGQAFNSLDDIMNGLRQAHNSKK